MSFGTCIVLNPQCFLRFPMAMDAKQSFDGSTLIDDTGVSNVTGLRSTIPHDVSQLNFIGGSGFHGSIDGSSPQILQVHISDIN